MNHIPVASQDDDSGSDWEASNSDASESEAESESDSGCEEEEEEDIKGKGKAKKGSNDSTRDKRRVCPFFRHPGTNSNSLHSFFYIIAIAGTIHQPCRLANACTPFIFIFFAARSVYRLSTSGLTPLSILGHLCPQLV